MLKRTPNRMPARVSWMPALLLLLVLSFAPLVVHAQDVVKIDRDDPSLVTYYMADGDVTVDREPPLGGSVISIRTVDNTFLGLTDLDPVDSTARPEVATEWSASEDGLTWTFKLRTDIPWVHWNPETQEATKMRNIVAQDVVTGVRRSCDGRLGGAYGPLTGIFIAGCADALAATEPTDADFEAIGVRAVDDATVEFTLNAPTGFFPSVASLWTLRPIPGELVEEFGSSWIEPGNAWFSGVFLQDTYTPAVGRTFVRNPFIPADLRGEGNIDRVDVLVINEPTTLLSAYLNGQIDMVRANSLPGGELETLLNDPALEDQLLFISGVNIDYLGFQMGVPPFDDVHVRRAFSAAIDRVAIINDAVEGLGTPLNHLTPPSMPAAPPLDQHGIGFDPEYAVEQMALSPYPGCQGFPEVYMVATVGRRSLYAEFLPTAWANILGCDPSVFRVEIFDDFSQLVAADNINNPIETRPNLILTGWGPDYPDANNYTGDILACNIAVGSGRPCSEVDDLIAAARSETDQSKRPEMYGQIEEMFFGPDGLFPVAPIRLSANYALYQTYLEGPFETDGQVGGEHWGVYTIDKAAQDAVRSGG